MARATCTSALMSARALSLGGSNAWPTASGGKPSARSGSASFWGIA